MLTNIICAAVLLVQSAASDSGRTRSGLWFSANGSGPAVLLLHGSNLDSRSWGALPNELATDHRVVIADLRSHGRSADASGPFSWSEDVVEVLDAARIERAVLIGHSLGAQIAIDVALTHPERVSALVLLGPAIGGKPLTKPPAGIERMVAALRANDMEAAGIALADMPVMSLRADTSAKALVRVIVMENTRLFRAQRAWIRAIDPPAFGRLSTLRMPVLVLLGAEDPTESNDAGRELGERLSNVAVRSLPRCGHLVPLDCADDTRRVIRCFLKEREPQRCT